MYDDIKTRPGATKRLENIEKREKDFNLEKKLLVLKNTINNHLTKSVEKFGHIHEIVVLGRKELGLLYSAHEMEIESDFKIEFNEEGFIDKIWNMSIYTGDMDSFVGVFSKADNIIFTE